MPSEDGTDELYPIATDEPFTVRHIGRTVKRTTVLIVIGLLALAAAMSYTAATIATNEAIARNDATKAELQKELTARGAARDRQQAADEAQLAMQLHDICLIVATLPAAPDLAELRRTCHVTAAPAPAPAPPPGPPASAAPHAAAAPRSTTRPQPTVTRPPARPPTSPKPTPKPSSTHLCVLDLICI